MVSLDIAVFEALLMNAKPCKGGSTNADATRKPSEQIAALSVRIIAEF
jgi:hypothetical protein